MIWLAIVMAQLTITYILHNLLLWSIEGDEY